MSSPGRRRTTIAASLLIGCAAVVAGTVAATAALGGTGTARVTHSPRLPVVVIQRGTLVQAQTVGGSVGYGPAWFVSGHGAGTITWLPRAGATIARGEQLYRSDDAPVTLFYGDLPLYRTLRYVAAAPPAGHHGHGHAAPPPPPQTGHDVELVAANLAALGFYGGDPAYASYDAALAAAVRAWQHAIGAPVTGVIGPADVVVAGGPVRVSSVLAHVDDGVNEQVLTLTGTAKLITLRVPPALAQSLAQGRRVTVTLPAGNSIRGRVVGIGSLRAGGSGSPGQGSVPVTVAALHPRVLDRSVLGAVSARIVTAARRHVLHVPITALLALAGGGYGLQLPDGRLVPVRIGMVADGEVQVSGAGIHAGSRVLAAQ